MSTFYLPIGDLPPGCVGDAQIAAPTLPGNAIPATKLKRYVTCSYTQPTGTAIVADTRGLHIFRGTAGTNVRVDACIIGAIATGADRTVDVTVKWGNPGNAYATIQSANIQFTNSSVLRTVSTATISVTSQAAGDSLIIVVAVAGSASAQAQGLLVTVTVGEDPS